MLQMHLPYVTIYSICIFTCMHFFLSFLNYYPMLLPLLSFCSTVLTIGHSNFNDNLCIIHTWMKTACAHCSWREGTAMLSSHTIIFYATYLCFIIFHSNLRLYNIYVRPIFFINALDCIAYLKCVHLHSNSWSIPVPKTNQFVALFSIKNHILTMEFFCLPCLVPIIRNPAVGILSITGCSENYSLTNLRPRCMKYTHRNLKWEGKSVL